MAGPAIAQGQYGEVAEARKRPLKFLRKHAAAPFDRLSRIESYCIFNAGQEGIHERVSSLHSRPPSPLATLE
jgi:hypothetical protein